MQTEQKAKRELKDRLKEEEKQRTVITDELQQKSQLAATLQASSLDPSTKIPHLRLSHLSQAQLADKQGRISDLNLELATVQREGTAAQAALQAERDKLREDLANTESQLKTTLQQEQREKRALEERTVELESHLAEEKDLHSASRDKLLQQEQLGLTLQAQLGEKQSRASDLESSVAELERRNEVLGGELKKEKEEHAAVDAALLEAKVVLEHQKVDLASLQEGLAGSQSDLAAKLQAERDLLGTVNELQKEKKELEVRLETEAKAAAAKLQSEQEQVSRDGSLFLAWMF